MNIRYRVDPSEAERQQLTTMLSAGKHPSRRIKRAQILLAADACVSNEAIARSVSVGGSTVYRTKRRLVEGNLELALSEEARPGAARKLSGNEAALLVATACSKAPRGRKRWTLDLLAGEMVRLTGHEELSRETVRRRLAEDDLSRGAATCGASRRWTAVTSRRWRMCSTSTLKRPIRSGQWFASMRVRRLDRRGAPANPGGPA